MQLYALIVAGGLGTRMNNNLPKQLIIINGQTVLQHTVNAFIDTGLSFNFIVVCHPNFIEPIKQTLVNYTNQNIQFVSGGANRYNSVQNGLALINGTQQSMVLVHDAVRCMVSPLLIKNIVDACKINSNAIPTISVNDSMRILKPNNQNEAIDRALLQIVQTPQAFLSNVILPVFEQNYQTHFTDEATVCELAGHKINLIPGEETNIKITYPSDIIFAQQILKKL